MCGSSFLEDAQKRTDVYKRQAYDVMFTANTWENSSAHIHSMGVMGKRSAVNITSYAGDKRHTPALSMINDMFLL